ncbi:MAG: DNA polymerase I [Campylobacter sp.]|nr:DNA polymerase I [Campylobacter sp.]
MKTLTIIDTFGFFFRLYYAMPYLQSSDGKPSGMVNGFANFINSLKKDYPSDYLIFALDSKGKTFRSDIDKNYKTNRKAPPKELKEQLVVCIDMIEKMNLCSYSKEGYEADDIIASAVKTLKNEDIQIHIVTHDKDLYQLIDDKVSILSPSKKILYGKDGCFEKFGVYPNQIRDFLAISGDSADNIPGVKGIGDKGAKKLLDEWGSLDAIYENIDKLPPNKQKEYLINGKESAYISKKLITLYDGLELPEIENSKFPNTNPLLKITDILESYSLNRLLNTLNISVDSGKKESEFNHHLLNDEDELMKIVNELKPDTKVAFDTETNSLDTKVAKVVGFSFCFGGKNAYYVPINHSYLGVSKQVSSDMAKSAVEKIYQSFVIGHNLKFDFEIVRNNFGLDEPQNYADTMILAWLSDPGSAVGMDALAKKLYNYETIKFESMVKKGDNFSSVELTTASKYGSQDAWITLRFYHTFENLLEPKLLKIASTYEYKFINVIRHMERVGIEIDRIKLRAMIEQNDAKIKALTNEIYDLVGERFNLNSTKQLGEVLFEKLNLPTKKKTKTGYSTDESVLNSLKDLHPVITRILDYREIYKLQSTYCEPLLNLARNDDESRIYTSFLQTGTATGRLSSKNPNLQNIPARGSMAKDIRDSFVAKDGYSFVGLDYSQIELRLLAHFSMDEALVEAFKNGEDIHTRTAINIFGESDSVKRAIAKSINFGLIYGMGANKLSNELGISKSEAKAHIQRYFEAFDSIESFLDGIKNDVKNTGFVSTLLGRKRFFDFSKATPMQIAMYEREAVNTKFQGSAADIIKLAMLEIYPYLDENRRLLLQIHDELIFEVKDEIASEFGEFAKGIMQGVAKLNVPLVSSLSIAKRWGELK